MNAHIAELRYRQWKLMLHARELQILTTNAYPPAERVSRAYYEHRASQSVEEARQINHMIIRATRHAERSNPTT